ncbi:rhoptry protein ROP4 [Besnoitia besnoiti]|uniref:Rhoptry protein ROP4 n=1 Tax=Besnoitia besnoiti TaxID=94643 RepID=A0A2A9MFY4_BESBE|nr:rhoptry protein ROP4 [Besnoitia besnoiti]PFH34507.1 rhoptry protein ROP4 [Besnoitia besnoiti]
MSRVFGRFRRPRLQGRDSAAEEGVGGLGQDLESNPALFRGVEPGDAIAEHLLTKISDVIQEDKRPVQAYTNLDNLLGETLWPQDTVVELVSVLTRATRRLRRGPVFGEGGSSMVFTASDEDTGEAFAVKAPVARSPPFEISQKDVMREGRSSEMFSTIKDPSEAQDRLRFLVASDVMEFPNRNTFTVALQGSQALLGNAFMLLPRAYTDLKTVTDALYRLFFRYGDFALSARLQLTHQLIRLVANLQSQGVVHGNVQAQNFLVMRDGRLFLADFSCMKEASGKTRAAKRCPSATMETDVTSLGSVLLELWDISVINVLPTEGEQEPPFRGVAPPSYVVRLIRGFIHHSRSKRVSPMQALTSPEMAQLVEEIQRSPLQYSSQGDSELAEGPPSGDGAGAAGQAASAEDAATSEPLGDTSGDDSDAPTTAAGTAGDIGGASDSQP